MKKKLPNVFVKTQSQKIKNNKETYYSAEEENEFILRKKKGTTQMVSEMLIRNKINNIFNSSNFVYKTKVKITLENDEIIVYIIAKNKEYLITLDNTQIKISDIKDITIV